MIVTLQSQISKLVLKHGSYKAAGKAIGLSYSRLNKLAKGHDWPTRDNLIRIGLEPDTAMYEFHRRDLTT